MEKFYIVKTITLDFKDGKEASTHKNYEHLVILYDSYNEAYNKILKSIINLINEAEYDMPSDEISAQFLKKNFDFNITLLPTDTKQETHYHYKKLKNGIFEEIENNIKVTVTTTIEKIEKEDVVFTIIDSDIIDGQIKSFKMGIFEDAEEMAVALSNYETFRKLDDEKKPYLTSCILDKSKIYDDDYICYKFVQEGFLEGFNPKCVNTLSYFNPELLCKNMLKVRKEIIEQKNNKAEIDSANEKEKEKMLKEIEDYKEKIERLEEELEEKDEIIRKVKDILK